MRNIFKGILVVFTILMLAGPASAGLIYSDTYTAEDTVIGSTTIDGDYIVAAASWVDALTLSGSFTGWEDLSGYTDVVATLTFTWHDDTLSYSGGTTVVTGQAVDPQDPGSAYYDTAIVSLEGTTIFDDVEVGEANSQDSTVYTYTLTLTDLSLLDDGTLEYLIEAGTVGNSRQDFIVDSVALEITGTAVPVPAAVWLLGSGIAGLGVLRRKYSV